MIKTITFIFFILFVNTNAVSQTDSISQQVDIYISEKMRQYQIPGIAVAVIKNNVIIKESSYGFCNLDNEVPVTSKTVFPIASMDKQIIATCIMMFYEQGKLKLTDRISNFIDSVPGTWNKIQIKHLLSHTSGLPDEVPEYFNKRQLITYSTQELLQNIKKQELQFQPGESWVYSDAGFFLLQLIVEKVSGMSYGEFLKKNILVPLKMHSTQTVNPKEIISNRATSYYKYDSAKIIVNTWRSIDYGPLYTDIGSTISDFAKYDVAIATNKLLKQSSYNMMWTPFALSDGSLVSNLIHEENLYWADASYGYAWAIRKFKNHRIIYHAGFTGTSITKLPDDSLTVILFTNLTGGFNPDAIARHIAAFYIPGSFFKDMFAGKDPYPATTHILKEQINKIGSGTIDSTAFSIDFLDALTPALPGFSKKVQKLGSLQSLEYLDSEKEMNKKIKIFYKANYTNGVLYYQVSMTKEKKIDFISVE
jgi:CubicO group peptidase (beta-lactamase class C family)